MDLSRIRQLSGLGEARLEDDLEDERRARERKIVKLIVLAFRKIDLTIAEEGIFYDEANQREAIIELDDPQIDLQRLDKLHRTGLANSYVISGSSNGLSLTFTVLPNLDNAVLA